MANKRFWLGMLVLALVFGMAVVGCDEKTEDDEEVTVTYDANGGRWDDGSTTNLLK